MRNTFANAFYEAAKRDKRLAVIVADISPAGSMQKFREEFPERFINTGLSEQAMIGICAVSGAGIYTFYRERVLKRKTRRAEEIVR